MTLSTTFLAFITFLLSFIALAQGSNLNVTSDANLVHGVDLSQPCSAGSFACMVRNGYHFAIVRCHLSVGGIDPHCVESIRAANAGGMAHVDAYLFPCPKCGNGKQQVINTVNTLRNSHSNFGMIWLDIEGTQYWLGNQARNRAFFQELLQGISATGVHAGIYSSKYQWESIFGSYSGGSHFDLWYAHYNGDPSYRDFTPFGGWSKPAIKQYKGDVSLCSCGVDLNAYP